MNFYGLALVMIGCAYGTFYGGMPMWAKWAVALIIGIVIHNWRPAQRT